MAQFLNTTKQNLSRWEKGYFEPDQEMAVRLARFFDVTIDSLFGLENEDGAKV